MRNYINIVTEAVGQIDWSAPLEFTDGTPIVSVEPWHAFDATGWLVHTATCPTPWDESVVRPDRGGTVIMDDGSVYQGGGDQFWHYPDLPRVRNSGAAPAANTEPTAEDIEAIVTALDAEGDVEIAGLRWKRSDVMQRMMGHDAWEKFLMRQFRTGDAASIHRAARNISDAS